METFNVKKSIILLGAVNAYTTENFNVPCSALPNRTLTILTFGALSRIGIGQLPVEYTKGLTFHQIVSAMNACGGLQRLYRTIAVNKFEYENKKCTRFDIRLRQDVVTFYALNKSHFSVNSLAYLLGLSVGTLNSWLNDETLFDHVYTVAKSRV